MSASNKKEYGDYQTPPFFAKRVCQLLKSMRINPKYVLEPTCGIGNFITATLDIFNPVSCIGIEINPVYSKQAELNAQDSNVEIINQDFFKCNLGELSLGEASEQLLIVGNLPWVNNSNLSSIGSNNVPEKSNFKDLKGIYALTGESNFDISEFIILSLIDAFKWRNVTIAVLCKTNVARNVFSEICRQQLSNYNISYFTFDAKAVFDVSASGCLLIVQFNNDARPFVCDISTINMPDVVESTLLYKDGKIVSSSTEFDFDGKCEFEWRQGIKHDCSAIMELKISEDGRIYNKKGDQVDIEETLLYPLVKSSDIKQAILNSFKRKILVTQRKPGDDTLAIKDKCPLTWEYLERNKSYFDKRKSTIYKKTHPFSLFGIGDYSFLDYKVVVSGLYKEPLFSLVYGAKPVMIDDTCYSISFERYDEAYVAMLILNSQPVQNFIKSIAFMDAKRPYSKKILDRIEIKKILEVVELEDLEKVEAKFKLDNYVKQAMVDDIKRRVKMDNRWF